LITVRWKRGAAGEVLVELGVPDGVVAQFEVPGGFRCDAPGGALAAGAHVLRLRRIE
jgi:hypothetical protein